MLSGFNTIHILDLGLPWNLMDFNDYVFQDNDCFSMW